MRVCSITKVIPAECWCPHHGSDDPEENERRCIIGNAKFEFLGGEALHVFITSKMTGGLVSLCNLRQAVGAAELAKLKAKGIPTAQCDQCKRTLRSKTPNVRLARYFQEQRAKSR